MELVPIYMKARYVLVLLSVFFTIYSIYFNNYSFVSASEASTEFAKRVVVEILARNPRSSDDEFALKGSGIIISRQNLERPVNVSDISDNYPYKYEYVVISNAHVASTINTEYSIRVNEKIRKIHDIYLPDDFDRERFRNEDMQLRQYDLSLLKFATDTKLDFLDINKQQRNNISFFSAYGWVEHADENGSQKFKFKSVENIEMKTKDEYVIYYKDNTGTLTEHGMSGGVLLTNNGEFVGVHRGIGIGIPSETASKFYRNYLSKFKSSLGSQGECFTTKKKKCSIPRIEMK
jgi:hypothetical protein